MFNRASTFRVASVELVGPVARSMSLTALSWPLIIPLSVLTVAASIIVIKKFVLDKSRNIVTIIHESHYYYYNMAMPYNDARHDMVVSNLTQTVN